MSARPKTATAEAFSRAGYRSPRDRLDEIADEVIASASFMTMDESRSEFYAKIGNDQALLWELFTPWHDTAATNALEGARLRRSAARKPSETKEKANPGSASQRPSGFTAGGATTLRDLERSRGRVAIISALNRVHINGRPIGEVSVEEAQGWRAKNLRDCRFVELVTSNLPPGAIIGQYITPEEADAFFEQAKRETENV